MQGPAGAGKSPRSWILGSCLSPSRTEGSLAHVLLLTATSLPFFLETWNVSFHARPPSTVAAGQMGCPTRDLAMLPRSFQNSVLWEGPSKVGAPQISFHSLVIPCLLPEKLGGFFPRLKLEIKAGNHLQQRSFICKVTRRTWKGEKRRKQLRGEGQEVAGLQKGRGSQEASRRVLGLSIP